MMINVFQTNINAPVRASSSIACPYCPASSEQYNITNPKTRKIIAMIFGIVETIIVQFSPMSLTASKQTQICSYGYVIVVSFASKPCQQSPVINMHVRTIPRNQSNSLSSFLYHAPFFPVCICVKIIPSPMRIKHEKLQIRALTRFGNANQ